MEAKPRHFTKFCTPQSKKRHVAPRLLVLSMCMPVPLLSLRTYYVLSDMYTILVHGTAWDHPLVSAVMKTPFVTLSCLKGQQHSIHHPYV